MLLKKLSYLIIVGALLLAGCAIGPDHPAIDWQHGAKRGHVVQFYTPDMPTADLPECLAALPKVELGKRHFVRVEYKHIRHLFDAIVDAPDTVQLEVNQQVEVWPDDCEHGKFGRIGRIFPSFPQE